MQDNGIGANTNLGLTFKIFKEQVRATTTIYILMSSTKLSSDTKQHEKSNYIKSLYFPKKVSKL